MAIQNDLIKRINILNKLKINLENYNMNKFLKISVDKFDFMIKKSSTLATTNPKKFLIGLKNNKIVLHVNIQDQFKADKYSQLKG